MRGVLWAVLTVVSINPFLFQPSVKSFGTERLIRTSLDLELDLQASKTWHDRLVQEISVLRELKEQLEQAQSQGEKELPQWVKDDERFRLLLRLVEKRVSNTNNTSLWILFNIWTMWFEKQDLRWSGNETLALQSCVFHLWLHRASYWWWKLSPWVSCCSQIGTDSAACK